MDAPFYSSHPIQHSKLHSSYPIKGHISREHFGNVAWAVQNNMLEIVDVYSKSVIATLEFPHRIHSTCVLSHNFELYDESTPIRHFLAVLHGELSLIDFSTLQIAHHFSFSNLLPNETLTILCPLLSYHQYELFSNMSNDEMEIQNKLYGYMSFPLLLGSNRGSLYVMDTLTNQYKSVISFTHDNTITSQGAICIHSISEYSNIQISCIESDWNTKCIALGFSNGAVLFYSFETNSILKHSSIDSVKELENQRESVKQCLFFTAAQEQYVWISYVTNHLSCIQVSKELRCVTSHAYSKPFTMQLISISDLHAASVYTNDSNLDRSSTMRKYLVLFTVDSLMLMELGPILYKGFSTPSKQFELSFLNMLDGYIDDSSIVMMEDGTLYFSVLALQPFQIEKWNINTGTLSKVSGEEEEDLTRVLEECLVSENWFPISNLLLAKRMNLNHEMIDAFIYTEIVWKWIHEQFYKLKITMQNKFENILSLGSMEISLRTKLLQEISVTDHQIQQLNFIVYILQEERVKREEHQVSQQLTCFAFYLKMMEWLILNAFIPNSFMKDCFASNNLIHKLWSQKKVHSLLINLFLDGISYPIASISEWITLFSQKQIAPQRLIIVWYYFLLDCHTQYPKLVPLFILTSFVKQFLLSKSLEKCITGIHKLDTLTKDDSIMEWQQACSTLCSSVNALPSPLTSDEICLQLLNREQYSLAYQVAQQMEIQNQQIMIKICVMQQQWTEALHWARKTHLKKSIYESLFSYLTHAKHPWLCMLTKEEVEEAWYPFIVENNKWSMLFEYWLGSPQLYPFAMELYKEVDEKYFSSELHEAMQLVTKSEKSSQEKGTLNPILIQLLANSPREQNRVMELIKKAGETRAKGSVSKKEVMKDDDDDIRDERLNGSTPTNGYAEEELIEVDDE